MQPVVLVALMVALLTADGQAGLPLAAPSWQTLPALAAYLLGALLLRQAATAVGLRLLRRQDAGLPVGHRGGQVLSLLADLWLAVGQAGPLALGYASWVFHSLHLADWPLVGKLAILAPYLAGQSLAWLLHYPLWHAGRRRAVGPDAPTWSRLQFLDFSLRHSLLFVLAPVCLLLLTSDLLSLAARAGWIGMPAVLGGSAACTLLVFLVAPVLIVRLWHTRRLPPGPLRDRLEATCRRLRLRYRDIRLWNTRGVLANAGVMGLAGPARYILLSDALLENLPAPQVQAVFAHEAAHILFRHIPYSALFGLSAVVCTTVVGELAGPLLGLSDTAVTAASLGLLAGVFFAGFGAISRRFERQADVFAAWASDAPGEEPSADPLGISPAGAAVFADALERVARLNGTPPTQYNWRHGSIAQRVDYILGLGFSGGTRRPADRSTRRVKALLWAWAAAGAALTAWLAWS